MKNMRTKILYVISSDDSDIYLEQLLVSVTSLRLYMPKGLAHVTVLTDDVTYLSMTGTRAAVLELIDEPIVVDFDKTISKYDRSRLLKTAMRKYVKGDFLYIDSDTIITDSLEEIDNFSHDLGAVWNVHVPFMMNPYRNWHLWQAEHIGWDASKETVYYNGGLCYAKDTPVAHEFFGHWNRNWIYSNREGIPNDEPAFAQADIDMNHVIHELPGEWNCQIKYGLRYFGRVKVLHFLCTQYMETERDCPYYFMDKNVYLTIKKSGFIDQDIMDKIKKPLECFNELTMILGGNEVMLLHDGTAIERLMLASRIEPSVYRFCNALVRLISRGVHFFKKIFRIK